MVTAHSRNSTWEPAAPSTAEPWETITATDFWTFSWETTARKAKSGGTTKTGPSHPSGWRPRRKTRIGWLGGTPTMTETWTFSWATTTKPTRFSETTGTTFSRRSGPRPTRKVMIPWPGRTWTTTAFWT